MTQVGNAGTANLADFGERPRYHLFAQLRSDPVADTLQRRAMVRRAQKHQMPELCQPAMTGTGCMVAGTARHQAAHAVRQQRQFLHRLRPGAQQLLQQVGQLLAVGGRVQAAVVVQVNRRAAELFRQRQAVVMRGG